MLWSSTHQIVKDRRMYRRPTVDYRKEIDIEDLGIRLDWVSLGVQFDIQQRMKFRQSSTWNLFDGSR